MTADVISALLTAAKLMDILHFLSTTDLGTCIEFCNCEHSEFRSEIWGICSKHQYQHKKHTGDARGISIVKDGTCDDWSRYRVVTYGAHEEFFSPPKETT